MKSNLARHIHLRHGDQHPFDQTRATDVFICPFCCKEKSLANKSRHVQLCRSKHIGASENHVGYHVTEQMTQEP